MIVRNCEPVSKVKYLKVESKLFKIKRKKEVINNDG